MSNMSNQMINLRSDLDLLGSFDAFASIWKAWIGHGHIYVH